MQKKSLSVVVPAYNEEQTLVMVVSNLILIAEKHLSDYELIIVNDASTDRTGEIADELANRSQKVRPVHNMKNMNLGWNFRKGLELARMDYFCMIPADDDILFQSLENIISSTGQDDLVLAYISNYEARHPLRRIVSKIFVQMMNFLFRLRVKYYNGPAIFKTNLIRSVQIKTFGFTYMAEIVVTLIKRGHSYIEVPMTLKPERKGANWKVFRLRNVWSVIKSIVSLWWRIQVLRKIN